MHQAWGRELARFASLLFPVMLVGWFSGFLWHSLFVFLSGYLAWLFYRLYKLEHWLRAGAKGESPASFGVMEEVYYHLYRQKKSDKKRKKKLSKLLSRFKKSTEALPDAAVVLSPANDIEWFNSTAESVLGLDHRDRGEQIVNLLRHPDFAAYLVEGVYGKTLSIPSPINNERELGVRVVSYGDGQKLLIAQDITQVKKLEKMRQDFVGNVSHELKTPLTVLKGYLEVLENGDLPDFARKPLKRMDEQANRMQNLINDLLTIARLESSRAKEDDGEFVNVPLMLQQICREVKHLENCPELHLELDSESGLFGNYMELQSAFTNLVMNAVKYTPAEGKVEVRWFENQSGIQLDVIDTGEGIAARHIPLLTQRFYRVDGSRSRAEGGTGLGLSIVKHVLSRHYAELKIKSTPGAGSTFSCIFPRNRIAELDSKVVTFL